MKIPNYIQANVIKLEKLIFASNQLLNEIETWVEKHGGDVLDDDYQSQVKDSSQYGAYRLDLVALKEYMKDR